MAASPTTAAGSVGERAGTIKSGRLRMDGTLHDQVPVRRSPRSCAAPKCDFGRATEMREIVALGRGAHCRVRGGTISFDIEAKFVRYLFQSASAVDMVFAFDTFRSHATFARRVWPLSRLRHTPTLFGNSS